MADSGNSTAPPETADSGVRARFARQFPAASLAIRNLSRQRLRAGLATLGIVIGVFAIVSLGMLGTALQGAALAELGGLGNQVIVSPAGGAESLDNRDLQAIQRAAAGHGDVVPLKAGTATVTGPGGETFAQLYGTTQPRTLFGGGSELPAYHRQGAIVGADAAASLDVRVGSTVEIAGNQYRVVAILEDDGSISPIRPGSAVVLPPDEFAAAGYSQVVVQANSGDDARQVASGVRERLNARERRVSVLSLTSILSQISEFFDLLNGFLLAVAGVSLVVAGVSIFNIMLMTVSERRGEIGVLRAVGIHREQVLRTLLAEATLLGVAGGTIGTAFGTVAVVGVALTTRLPLSSVLVSTNLLVAVGAFAFGVLVALVGGLYPAYRAAWEPPVESLRG